MSDKELQKQHNITIFLSHLSTWIVKLFFQGLSLLPFSLRESLFTRAIRIFVWFLPKYRHIALCNFEQVFPNRSLEEKEQFLSESYRMFAHFLINITRMPSLDVEWMRKNLHCSSSERLKEIQRENPGKGTLIISGHLGMFEFVAWYLGSSGYPLSVIVRDLKNPVMNQWWNSVRERSGIKVVPRTGSFRKSLKLIQEGMNVGIMFDQNVTRNHAVFVPFFGRPAATTMAPGFIAVTAQCPVVVCGIRQIGPDQYEIDGVECDLKDIYANTEMGRDQKIEQATLRMIQIFEQMLLRTPAAWFWMHRRWKTTPEGTPEDFYTVSKSA